MELCSEGRKCGHTIWGKHLGKKVVVWGTDPGPGWIHFIFQGWLLICSLGSIIPTSPGTDRRTRELIFVKHLEEGLHRVNTRCLINEREWKLGATQPSFLLPPSLGRRVEQILREELKMWKCNKIPEYVNKFGPQSWRARSCYRAPCLGAVWKKLRKTGKVCKDWRQPTIVPIIKGGKSLILEAQP